MKIPSGPVDYQPLCSFIHIPSIFSTLPTLVSQSVNQITVSESQTVYIIEYHKAVDVLNQFSLSPSQCSFKGIGELLESCTPTALSPSSAGGSLASPLFLPHGAAEFLLPVKCLDHFKGLLPNGNSVDSFSP